jgi:hypothetical protein
VYTQGTNKNAEQHRVYGKLVFEQFTIMKNLDRKVKENKCFCAVNLPAIYPLRDELFSTGLIFMEHVCMEIYVFARS